MAIQRALRQHRRRPGWPRRLRRLAAENNHIYHYGRWNRIAILWLPGGTGSYVRLSNRGNGYVAADAMRFRYLKRVVPDVTPPRRPVDLRLVR